MVILAKWWEYTPVGGIKRLNDTWNAATSARDYSDFSRMMNQHTDGWYGTAANALPIVTNVHNALLGRDEQKDYLNENGMDWDQVQGYNAAKINFGISNNISSLANAGGNYLQNVSNDLGKLYSGQKDPQQTLDKWM